MDESGTLPPEEKLKSAARAVFHRKGYAATRTRDIAEEAGMNLALLNYYFRSKENLFDIIMLESMQRFMRSITGVFNDRQTTLEEKIESLVQNYIDTLVGEPDIPLFILSELRTNPARLFESIDIRSVLMQSHLLVQLREAIEDGRLAPIHPMHFIMNVMGLTVFPFVAKPMLTHLGSLSEEEFNAFMEQRKRLVPVWLKAILQKP